MLEDDIVETGLEVYHRDPFGSAQPGAVAPGIIELVLVFLRSLIYGDDVLAYPEGLPGLLARDQ